MKFLDQPRLAEPRLTHDQDQLPVALPCPLPAPHQHGHFLVGRREPIETRKSTLRSLLRGKHAGIVFNAHFTSRMARSSTARLARSVVRVSCRSAWARRTAPAAPSAG
jgi:hypothetical protein